MRRLSIVVAVFFGVIASAVQAPPSGYGQESLTPEQRSIEGKKSFSSFKFWVNAASQEARELEAKGSKAANTDVSVKFFRNCVEMYQAMMKDGIPPTYKIRREDEESWWTGTLEEIRQKQCDPWLKKASTMAATQDAPYRKVLKNDKLSIALDQRTVFLPGRVETGDPQKMAAAPVWFAHLIADTRCPNGSKVNTVRRYQFDGQHKLLKSAEQKFCGTPPISAYK